MNKNQEFEANLQNKQYSEKSPLLRLAIAGKCWTAKLFQNLGKTFHGIAIYSLFGSSLWPAFLVTSIVKMGQTVTKVVTSHSLSLAFFKM